MLVVQSYSWAVLLCIITMCCWGSWGNTQKLCRPAWRFQLYYWDYVIGMMLVAIIAALTIGSIGETGMAFWPNLKAASNSAIGYAFLSGALFNFSNFLLAAAIEIAGMAIAFPIGVGIALSLGVLTGYLTLPIGNPWVLTLGVLLVFMAVLLDAIAYRRLGGEGEKTPTKGIVVAVICGLVMGIYFPFMSKALSPDLIHIESGMLTPYSGVFVFSLGIVISNFAWNTVLMKKPLIGKPIAFSEYFKGTRCDHGLGLAGGVLTGIGLLFLIMASNTAGFAISYGLAQGATMIAAVWGVFAWREFAKAPKGTNTILVWMFICYLVGLGSIVVARIT